MIHHLVKGKIILAIAELLCCINIAEYHMCDTLHNRRGINRRILDFSLNILFFIRQEVISITRASDIVLAHQAVKGSPHLFPHDDLIHADIIRHQDNDIIQIRLDIIDIANQI